MSECERSGGSQEIQLGLRVCRSGDALEVVTANTGESRLLASGVGFEISELTLNRGGEMMLVPFDEGVQGTEIYYVLSGVLEVHGSGSVERIEEKDYLVADTLEEPAFISTPRVAHLLYMSSQPTFPEMKDSMQSLMQLAVEVEEKDGYTAEHCRRLRRLSSNTARQLNLDAQQRYLLSYASYLHDVGKARVPVEILQKPGPLTEAEWETMKMHTTYGRQLLEDTAWQEVGQIVEQHHERMDGSGYPRGLSGEEIRTEAYIVAVADMYDAMTTDRPYRNAMSQSDALAEIRRFAGVHYPEEVAGAFLRGIDADTLGPTPRPASGKK